MLAEEMENLAQCLLEYRVADPEEALAVLMQSILQLSPYLDRIQQGQDDQPALVIPILNDLRAACGESLLSETALFSPYLEERLPQVSKEVYKRLKHPALPALLAKLRQMYQVALIGYIRSPDKADNLQYLSKVFSKLGEITKGSPQGELWLLEGALVEGLRNKAIVSSPTVTGLLKQPDRFLRALIEDSAAAIEQELPEELLKNILFYLAHSQSQDSLTLAAREHYRLDNALSVPSAEDIRRPDSDAIRSVVDALSEELLAVKDSLDLFVRNEDRAASQLEGLLPVLRQVADTMAVLGFGEPRVRVQDQLVVLEQMISDQHFDDDLLMDVASSLIYVDVSLAGMVSEEPDNNDKSDGVPDVQAAEAHRQVIYEACSGLEQVKEAFVDFIASQWDRNCLQPVPGLLTSVRGGLQMIPLPRAAAIIQSCYGYVSAELLTNEQPPSWSRMDMLADTIASVEYYLERFDKDDEPRSDSILDMAEESLTELGYPLPDLNATHESLSADPG